MLLLSKCLKRVHAFCMPATNQRFIFFVSSKVLGVIFLIAFISLYIELPGLYLSEGLLPISKLLEFSKLQQISFFNFPEFFIGSSDLQLKMYVWVGILASVFIIMGVVPALSTLCCWLIYLSFVNCGQAFMSFQWDVLLLEVGFICFLGTPWKWIWRHSHAYAPPKLVIWAAWACLARLMISSGMVKWLSGDMLWREFKALNVHYLTQPLPQKLSWFASKLPESIQQISVGVMFLIECFVPILIIINRRLRHMAAHCFIGLMCMIMVTGNYCFFNLLTCLLAWMLYDDALFKKSVKKIEIKLLSIQYIIVNAVAICLIILGLTMDANRLIFKSQTIQSVTRFYRYIQPWHIINQYGLFAVMTRQRNEIELWGRIDEHNWKPYTFKYKPNSATDAPRWTMFMQPRFDWQLWFAALRGYSKQSWVNQIVVQLFNNSKSVKNLFENVPFTQAPKELVFLLRPYEFSSYNQLKKGQWWKVGNAIAFSPVFSNPAFIEQKNSDSK